MQHYPSQNLSHKKRDEHTGPLYNIIKSWLMNVEHLSIDIEAYQLGTPLGTKGCQGIYLHYLPHLGSEDRSSSRQHAKLL